MDTESILNVTKQKRGLEETSNDVPSCSKKLKSNDLSYVRDQKRESSNSDSEQHVRISRDDLLDVLTDLARNATDSSSKEGQKNVTEAEKKCKLERMSDSESEIDAKIFDVPIKETNTAKSQKKKEKPILADVAQGNKSKKELMSDSENEMCNEPNGVTRTKKPQSKKKEELDLANAAHEARIRQMLFNSDDDEDEVKMDSSSITVNLNQRDVNEASGIVAETTNNVETTKPEDKSVKIENDQDANATALNHAEDKAGPSNTNNKNQRRDRCWYDMGCYRKSASHLAEFSHPGDSDYDSEPTDGRPVCSFGAACYRRNKDHRQAYKHPKNQQKPPNTKKKPTPNKRRAPKQQYKDDTPEDDYDLEDPFIDSGSEFEADSISDDDTDSDFSGESEEESKRLLKEAKRFTKGKKK